MPNRWQPTPQECELIADMIDADRPKAAIAKFLYLSESTLRRFWARARARRGAAKVGNDAGVTLLVTPDAIQPILRD